MNNRSSYKWKCKPGGWDVLNTELINFNEDYPQIGNVREVSSFVTTICNDYKKISQYSLISTFVDDYILERYWNNPLKYVAYYKTGKYVMSPDYSLLVGMPEPMQKWNLYRNRLVGHVWQEHGLNVIPTISWSDELSLNYYLNGINKNMVVAVSNCGVRNENHKKYFDAGFFKMVEKINPSQIIFQCNSKYKCEYSQSNIIFIDSFWDFKRKNKII